MTRPVCTVRSEKGGVGKSTLSRSLLAAAFPHACLVDLETNDCLPWAKAGQRYGRRVAEAHSVERLAALLAEARRSNWWTFINTPGMPGDGLVRAAIEAASLVIIPLTPSRVDLARTLGSILEVERAGRPYLVVLTRAMARVEGWDARQTAEMRAELAPFREHLWAGQISQAVLYDYAEIAGLGVTDYPSSKPATEIRNLLNHIRERLSKSSYA